MVTNGAAMGPCLPDWAVARPTSNLGAGTRIDLASTSPGKLDVLFVVDNSRSMDANQVHLAEQLQYLVNELIGAGSDAGATGGVVKDLHVAVISTDLGVGGRPAVPSCDYDARVGDDGLFDPAINGPAFMSRASLGMRPPLTMHLQRSVCTRRAAGGAVV